MVAEVHAQLPLADYPAATAFLATGCIAFEVDRSLGPRIAARLLADVLPLPARAEVGTRAESQGLDRAVEHLKHEIGKAEGTGQIAGVEQALQELLRELLASYQEQLRGRPVRFAGGADQRGEGVAMGH